MLFFFCGGSKIGRPGEENSVQGENQLNHRTAPGRNRTRDTLVGRERSHHCAIPAPGKEVFPEYPKTISSKVKFPTTAKYASERKQTSFVHSTKKII